MNKATILLILIGLMSPLSAAWADSSPAPSEPGTVESLDASGATPQVTIDRLNEALLDIMRRADELGYRGRYEVVAPVVRETFDTTFMASKSIGPAWRKLAMNYILRMVIRCGRVTRIMPRIKALNTTMTW